MIRVLEYKELDMNEIMKKPSRFISTEEALEDIEPIDWDEKVLCGQ